MAFTPEELEQIKALMQANAPVVPQAAPPSPPTPDRVAAPWFYVHLADGRVLETQDSQSTVVDDKAVIGRYPMSDADAQAAQERQ